MTTELRRCIGSARFGTEPHQAPMSDFPKQPSQKDGLGRMCQTHWNAYTRGLARDAKARKAASLEPAPGQATPTKPRRAKAKPEPVTVRASRRKVRRVGEGSPSPDEVATSA